MKRLFTLSIFAFIALAFWGLQSYEKKKDVAITEGADPHFVDLFMRNFTLTAMDENGKPAYTLQASYFEHYNDSSSSTMEQPVMHLLKENNRWVISAKTGEINDEQSLIVLHDDVVMQQQETEFPVQVETSLLEIDTTKQIARSDRAVNIIHKELNMRSNGMVLDNAAGELELLANVKGSYVRID